MIQPTPLSTEVSGQFTEPKYDTESNSSSGLETVIETVERRAAERRLELPVHHRSMFRRGAEWAGYCTASLLLMCLLLAFFEIGEHIGLVSIVP